MADNGTHEDPPRDYASEALDKFLAETERQFAPRGNVGRVGGHRPRPGDKMPRQLREAMAYAFTHGWNAGTEVAVKAAAEVMTEQIVAAHLSGLEGSTVLGGAIGVEVIPSHPYNPGSEAEPVPDNDPPLCVDCGIHRDHPIHHDA